MQMQLRLYYITQHYATLIKLHYTTNTATTTTAFITLHCTTLHYTTLDYTLPHYSTLHYRTLQRTTIHLITPHHTTPRLQLQLELLPLHYANNATLQLKFRYATLQLRYTTLHPAIVVRWALRTLQPLKIHNSNHPSVHQWRIRRAIRDSQQPASPIGIFENSATAWRGTSAGIFRQNLTMDGKRVTFFHLSQIVPVYPWHTISPAETSHVCHCQLH